MQLFLDTNVVIDVLANREPFSFSASKLFDLAERGKIKLYISALSFSNIYYILRKTCSQQQMISVFRDLESLVETIDVTKAIIQKALTSDFKDFEDAIQYYTAVTIEGETIVVTRNVKDYRKTDRAVLTPDEVLAKYVATQSPGK